uniref:Insulin-like peptide 1 n=1 Tax=Sinonovacula constricta TaxID=98310 RepID=A0A0P0CCI5_SINCO|nr:insulin-like peptide 1 [Sinonovacula constricta]
MGYFGVIVLYVFIYIQYVVVGGSARLVPYKRSGDKVCTPGSRVHRQGVCGMQISELLKTVCGSSGYFEEEYKKRSPDVTSSTPLLDMDAKEVLLLSRKARSAKLPENHALSDVLFNKEDATMFLDKRDNFHQTGIVCECCYNRCGNRKNPRYCKGEKMGLKKPRFMVYRSRIKK